MPSSNGETRIPSFEEMVRGLSLPIPPIELSNPERLWGSLAAAGALLDHFLLVMEASQKKQLLDVVSAMRELVDAAAFKSFKESQAIEPRFAGMLELLDNTISRLRGF